MDPLTRIPREQGEHRELIGWTSACSDEIRHCFWISFYWPPHDEYGGWALWKCCDWINCKPQPTNLKEIEEVGLYSNYRAAIGAWYERVRKGEI